MLQSSNRASLFFIDTNVTAITLEEFFKRETNYGVKMIYCAESMLAEIEAVVGKAYLKNSID